MSFATAHGVAEAAALARFEHGIRKSRSPAQKCRRFVWPISIRAKDLLPEAWWAVAECVDAYETESRRRLPRSAKSFDGAGPRVSLRGDTELVKVDLERRWNARRAAYGWKIICGNILS